MANDDNNGENSKEMSQAYKTLLSKRDNLVKSIMNHEDKVKNGGVTTRHMASSRLNTIEATRKKYMSVMDKILEHEEYDPDHLQVDNDDVEDSYHVATAAFKEILDRGQEGSESMSLSSTMATRTNESSHAIKLPTISIPTFDGKDLLQWTTFYDTFSSLVDQNTHIAKINKMHYLRDSLTGDAFRTISKLPASEMNYEIAWKTLQEKYHNPRALVNHCLKTFLFQEPISKQNANDIRNLIDTTKESLQCIENLDIPIEDWDPLLVYVLQTKLDKETSVEWEKKLNGTKEIPKYNEMIC